MRLPSLPPLYIGPLGGAPALGDGISKGAAAKGVECPPSQVGRPTPRVSNPTPKLSRWPKLDFLYINLYLRTIPELLVTSGISSGTLNNFRVTAY